MTRFQRNGPDGLQKYFLYLIIADWLLLILGGFLLSRVSFVYAAVICIMLLLYNVLLVKLCFIRARRASDGYLLYPVVTACLVAGGLLAWQFLFR
ncbi:hypothetical protein [Ferrimonas pelagia]|uniref:Uncharacterized protein n=1 Tax=Ferrimonas pelagia TaxID=1177826 RepID=A0ABP9ECX7_9GAMM